MNKFFTSALLKAMASAKRPQRLLLLLSQMALKLKGVNWNQVNVISAREKLLVLGRLVKAYAVGQYRDVSLRTIALVIAAIFYFVNPLDFIPDLLPLTGLTDDFAILIWVYTTVNSEIEKFMSWEKSQFNS